MKRHLWILSYIWCGLSALGQKETPLPKKNTLSDRENRALYVDNMFSNIMLVFLTKVGSFSTNISVFIFLYPFFIFNSLWSHDYIIGLLSQISWSKLKFWWRKSFLLTDVDGWLVNLSFASQIWKHHVLVITKVSQNEKKWFFLCSLTTGGE